MSMKNYSFRDLYEQVVFVRGSKQDDIKEAFIEFQDYLLPADVDSCLCYCYVDPEAGLSFHFLCFANFDNESIDMNSYDVQAAAELMNFFLYDSDYEIKIFAGDSSAFLERIQMVNTSYHNNKDVLATRDMTEIDHLRHESRPDDIMALLIKDGLEIEYPWIRLSGIRANELDGKLLNEPEQDFGLQRGDTVQVLLDSYESAPSHIRQQLQMSYFITVSAAQNKVCAIVGELWNSKPKVSSDIPELPNTPHLPKATYAESQRVLKKRRTKRILITAIILVICLSIVDIYFWGFIQAPGAMRTVAVGDRHKIAIAANGSLWAWGYDDFGQLGGGNIVVRHRPARIGRGRNWKTVAAGDRHSAAIQKDGSLWAWGENGSGQLGDGTRIVRAEPVQVGVDTGWVNIAVGNAHTAALQSDGSLWTWGNNFDGQLGDGTSTSRAIPVQIGTDTDWISVTAGSAHTIALRSDETLWAWGANEHGQLGIGTTYHANSPVQVITGTSWASVEASCDRTVAIAADGSLWAWGANWAGQLGDGTAIDRTAPVQIDNSTEWASVAVGSVETAAIATDGSLWSWRTLDVDYYGNVIEGQQTMPIQFGRHTDWESVAMRGFHGLGVRSDGSLWRWESVAETDDWRWQSTLTSMVADRHGRVGISHIRLSPSDPETIPMDCTLFPGIGREITAGTAHTAAIAADGTLWAWGRNTRFHLGNGTRISRTTPMQISTDTDWVSVSSSSASTVAIRSDGSLWAWGLGRQGLRGGIRGMPIQIGENTDWISVDAGNNHTLAMRSDGSLWAYGLEDEPRNMPIQVGTETDWIAASTGEDYIVGLRSDGSLWIWGDSGWIQFGTDTDWVSVSASGIDHSAAIRSDGTLWAWGLNDKGQLGDGTTVDREDPVQVGTDANWVSVITRGNTTMAIQNDGSLWAWGCNWSGLLGDGTTGSVRTMPKQVGTDTDWISIALGADHVVALRTDGSIWAWGSNQDGQLGDGTTRDRHIPVRVLDEVGWSEGAG